MSIVNAAIAGLVFAGIGQLQERVSFATQDGGVVYADVYGTGDRGVVLAHGGRFNKESWTTQAQALADEQRCAHLPQDWSIAADTPSGRHRTRS